jgi:hypothetical protein
MHVDVYPGAIVETLRIAGQATFDDDDTTMVGTVGVIEPVHEGSMKYTITRRGTVAE